MHYLAQNLEEPFHLPSVPYLARVGVTFLLKVGHYSSLPYGGNLLAFGFAMREFGREGALPLVQVVARYP